MPCATPVKLLLADSSCCDVSSVLFMLVAGSSIQATSPGSIRMVLNVREHRKVVLQANSSRDASAFASYVHHLQSSIDGVS
jgi:hypothetical protein